MEKAIYNIIFNSYQKCNTKYNIKFRKNKENFDENIKNH